MFITNLRFNFIWIFIVCHLFFMISKWIFLLYLYFLRTVIASSPKNPLQNFMAKPKFKEIWFYFSLYTCEWNVLRITKSTVINLSLLSAWHEQLRKSWANISRTANDTAWWFSYVHFICCQMPTWFYEQSVIMFSQSWVNNKICLNDSESLSSQTKNNLRKKEEHEKYEKL